MRWLFALVFNGPRKAPRLTLIVSFLNDRVGGREKGASFRDPRGYVANRDAQTEFKGDARYPFP